MINQKYYGVKMREPKNQMLDTMERPLLRPMQLSVHAKEHLFMKVPKFDIIMKMYIHLPTRFGGRDILVFQIIFLQL